MVPLPARSCMRTRVLPTLMMGQLSCVLIARAIAVPLGPSVTQLYCTCSGVLASSSSESPLQPAMSTAMASAINFFIACPWLRPAPEERKEAAC